MLNMFLKLLFLCLTLLLSAAFSRPTSLLGLPAPPVDTTPLPPSEDPWYSPTTGFESEKPGTMLRIRVAPGNLTETVGRNCSAGIQILYRTTDSNIQPSWAVTTVLLPHTVPNTPPVNGTALLSYQMPYDSADIDASPSYALYFPRTTKLSEIQGALGLGWYVSVPDFEGPLASFTLGLQSGYATLDSVRVVLSLELEPLGLSRNPRYAMWGYSGGALACEWAAELQAQYAPDLNFVGAALGGLTPNLSCLVSTVNGGPFAGLLPAGLLGITSQSPSAYNYILSRLKPSGPYNSTTFLGAKNEILLQTESVFANQNIYNYFIGGRADVQDSPIIKDLLDSQGIMGYHGVPRMPLFVYKAIHDELSPIADTDALVNKYCAVDVNIRYERNTIGGHIAEETNGEGHAFQYLSSLFNGIAPSLGCVISNTAINATSDPL